ncbi:MAG: PilZ domain-containing protein [Pseudomonadota bacterium]
MDRYSFDPVASLPADDAAHQRGEVRDSLFLAAHLTVSGEATEQVRVRNLSAGGMMAEYAAPVEIGTKVAVELRGIGAIAGRIAWATDGRIGIAFDQHIDPMRARKPVAAKPTLRR